MRSSLTSRLSRTLFLLIAATVASSMVVVELFVDDVEDTILDLELKADGDYFRDQLRNGEFQPIKTARLEALFLPRGEPDTALPDYFQEPDLPFSREVEVGERTLLVVGEVMEEPAGRLLLAQDITIMENREFLVQLILAGVAAGMLLIGFFIARAGARYLVGPFHKLAREVLATEPGSSIPRIAADYPDQEFCHIAEAFNRFLSELERHIEREKSFVKLASHELRTPLAVMSGALDVLDQRQSLSNADRKTLGRLRRAVHTMRDDTEVLLELARSETSRERVRTVVLQELVQNTIDDLEQGQPDQRGRIVVLTEGPGMSVTTHPSLVRLLFRNLLQNALRHTQASVEVRFLPGSVRIKDFGPGLPQAVVANLGVRGTLQRPSAPTDQLNNTTFGLLIVRMVCEELGWELRIGQSDDQGTEFVLVIDRWS